MQLRTRLVIGALALALAPAPAQAQDWFLTPFVGANFGGNATFEDFDDFDDEVEKRVDFGATIGWNPSVVRICTRPSTTLRSLPSTSSAPIWSARKACSK